MNDDILDGKWKQVKGNVRNWWGKLTDDDVDKIAGKSEKMVGRLQERYGWTKERASEGLTTRLVQYDAEVKTGIRLFASLIFRPGSPVFPARPGCAFTPGISKGE
jgi:uncharacterized protein YjbJ (UPF0337 family)